MLKLSELKPYKGSTKRRKVVGRGVGSGHGTFSGRGSKGQKARSGGNIPAGFEGGRMPLQRQLPKRRGFRSIHAKVFILDLSDLDKKFKAGETVNPKILANKGMVKSTVKEIKILGSGELKKALVIEKIMVTATAKEKIEKAGGKITIYESTKEPKLRKA